MTRQAGVWVTWVLCAGLTASCTSKDGDTTTVPSQTAAGTPAPSNTQADAGTPQAPAAPTTPSTAGAPAAAASGKPGSPAAGSGGTEAGSRALAADSGETDAGSGEPHGEESGTGTGGTSQTDRKLSAFIDVKDIPTGAEAHRCVLVELPNTEPVWVSTLHATLSNGSHHMIIDRRSAEDELLTDAELCSPTMGDNASRLLIAQQHETTLNLPQGVGYLLEPKQRMFLQLHYINTTDKPVAIKGTIELTLFPKDARPIEAKSVFTGSTSINLPARQAGESKHYQVLPADKPWNVFALTSHTHQLGVHSTIERVASATAPVVTPLHESRDWAEPPLTVFDKPLLFDGTDGLRLTCRYMNNTDRDVHFGTGVNDEMCFMWLYYFENDQR